MPSRTTYTNPRHAKTKIPRQRGTFANSPPAPEPNTPLPKPRPGEVIKSGPSVKVTNKSTRAQHPAGGNF